VLVIIGLVIGGVLVGRDLIKAAERRSMVSQVQQLDAATTAFRLKYGKIPGDIDNAVALGLGTDTNLHDGDGNGQIFSHLFMFSTNYGSSSKEMMGALLHLSNAGLIAAERMTGYDGFTSFDGDFTGRALPLKIHKGAFISMMSITDTSSGDYALGNAFLIHGSIPGSGAFERILTVPDAFYIDTKIDDGDGFTGSVRTNYPYSGPRVSADTSGCLLGGASPGYNFEGHWQNYAFQIANPSPNPEQRVCTMAIRGSW
jgi:hypothetical protein